MCYYFEGLTRAPSALFPINASWNRSLPTQIDPKTPTLHAGICISRLAEFVFGRNEYLLIFCPFPVFNQNSSLVTDNLF